MSAFTDECIHRGVHSRECMHRGVHSQRSVFIEECIPARPPCRQEEFADLSAADPDEELTVELAPEPTDILWENLEARDAHGRLRACTRRHAQACRMRLCARASVGWCPRRACAHDVCVPCTRHVHAPDDPPRGPPQAWRVSLLLAQVTKQERFRSIVLTYIVTTLLVLFSAAAFVGIKIVQVCVRAGGQIRRASSH